MARILVTGGTGYIGSHTVVELIQQGYDVVIIDNLSNSRRDVLDGIENITGIRPDFVTCDCANEEMVNKVFEMHNDIVAVIHFAASKAVGESVEQPLMYYKNNMSFWSLIYGPSKPVQKLISDIQVRFYPFVSNHSSLIISCIS